MKGMWYLGTGVVLLVTHICVNRVMRCFVSLRIGLVLRVSEKMHVHAERVPSSRCFYCCHPPCSTTMFLTYSLNSLTHRSVLLKYHKAASNISDFASFFALVFLHTFSFSLSTNTALSRN